MGYQLQVSEDLRDAMRRIATERVDYAIEQLGKTKGDRDKQIHEARKSFKQIRAVLRLIRGTLDKDVYSLENETYRDAGRILGPLRDAFVRIETLDESLEAIDNPEASAAASFLRENLQARYNEAHQSLVEDRTIGNEVIDTLKTARERIPQWELNDEGFDLLAPGLQKIYRQGVGAMHAASDDEFSAEAYHEWRKRVKYLWNQMRVLESLNPPMLSPLVEKLDNLGDLLGDANDLAVLQEDLRQYDMTETSGGQVLLHELENRRVTLLKQAQEAGKGIYSESPKMFVARIRGYYWMQQQLEQP
jgi:CHAD domain-containing protein